MAIDLKYPILPIYFDGNNRLSVRFDVSKSGTVEAHIHPPIDTTNWHLETIDDHIKEVRDLYLNCWSCRIISV